MEEFWRKRFDCSMLSGVEKTEENCVCRLREESTLVDFLVKSAFSGLLKFE